MVKNTEKYVIALPIEDLGVREYDYIKKVGGSVATTPASAVSKYLFRLMPGKARIVLATLRDDFGGAGSYAMAIPEEFRDSNGNVLRDNDKLSALEIEVASFLSRQYEGDPRNYLDEARRVLNDFKKVVY